MHLSYKIPVITGVAIVLTICVNILAFSYFMNTLFTSYSEEILELEQQGSFSPEKLSTILDVSSLAPEKQDEYKAVVVELSHISTSLKNISENPELYLQSEPTGASKTPSQKESRIQNPFEKISSLFISPTNWGANTPEGTLIRGLITRLIIVNIVWLFCITGLYFLWIRKVFSPIYTIIDRLNTYIDKARFQNIPYKRNDEFLPLISTINNLHKSLKIQETIRSNFLSDISHEIRTPITAVRCYLEAIEDGMMQLDEKSIPLLKNELTRLTRITEQIMEYEHLTHHKHTDIHIQKFGLKKILTELYHEYLPQLEKNTQRIDIDYPTDISIFMDTDMCIQILHNILSNFIKYAGKGTTLRCSFSKKKNTVELYFSDNGIGIPTEEIDFVREKFYRVDKSRTQNESMSMGIGLSIIDHIVRIHNGVLHIKNNTPEPGLLLTIILPRS